MNYYKLNHGTYPGTTHVYFNCTPDELIKHYDNKYKKNKLSKDVKELINDKTDGIMITEDYVFIVYLPKFQNKSNYYSILTHELLHATFRALEYYGVHYNNADDSEPFTYFIDYLVSQLYKETFKTDYPDI